jgi:hypothetical protein
MEFKGTKGNWWSCCIKKTPHYVFAAEGETTICGFYKKQYLRDDLSDEELRANALLISKSPEILEMLSFWVNQYEGHGCFLTSELIEKSKQLIKEATEI